jgi:hypothetical protein
MMEACTNNSQQRAKYFSVLVVKVIERAAKYCNASSRTIQRISNICAVDSELSTPRKTAKRQNVRNADIDHSAQR